MGGSGREKISYRRRLELAKHITLHANSELLLSSGAPHVHILTQFINNSALRRVLPGRVVTLQYSIPLTTELFAINMCVTHRDNTIYNDLDGRSVHNYYLPLKPPVASSRADF